MANVYVPNRKCPNGHRLIANTDTGVISCNQPECWYVAPDKYQAQQMPASAPSIPTPVPQPAPTPVPTPVSTSQPARPVHGTVNGNVWWNEIAYGGMGGWVPINSAQASVAPQSAPPAPPKPPTPTAAPAPAPVSPSLTPAPATPPQPTWGSWLGSKVSGMFKPPAPPAAPPAGAPGQPQQPQPSIIGIGLVVVLLVMIFFGKSISGFFGVNMPALSLPVPGASEVLASCTKESPCDGTITSQRVSFGGQEKTAGTKVKFYPYDANNVAIDWFGGTFISVPNTSVSYQGKTIDQLKSTASATSVSGGTVAVTAETQVAGKANTVMVWSVRLLMVLFLLFQLAEAVMKAPPELMDFGWPFMFTLAGVFLWSTPGTFSLVVNNFIGTMDINIQATDFALPILVITSLVVFIAAKAGGFDLHPIAGYFVDLAAGGIIFHSLGLLGRVVGAAPGGEVHTIPATWTLMTTGDPRAAFSLTVIMLLIAAMVAMLFKFGLRKDWFSVGWGVITTTAYYLLRFYFSLDILSAIAWYLLILLIGLLVAQLIYSQWLKPWESYPQLTLGFLGLKIPLAPGLGMFCLATLILGIVGFGVV